MVPSWTVGTAATHPLHDPFESPLASIYRCARTEGSAIARIDDLMDKVDSKFHLVHLSAKRAREINGYFAHLGEGLGSYVPPLISTETNKPLSIALEEIATGKIEGVEPTGEGVEDPLAFIANDGGDEAS